VQPTSDSFSISKNDILDNAEAMPRLLISHKSCADNGNVKNVDFCSSKQKNLLIFFSTFMARYR